MISSISTCPKCETLVLSDTIQCPSCHHVLLPDRADEAVLQSDKQAEDPSVHTDEASEVPCRECGVMVRRGVVRCWNCGGFQEQDIEARFIEMQETEPEAILSNLDDENEVAKSPSQAVDDGEEYDSDYFGEGDEDEDFFTGKKKHQVDDDFELADEVDIYEAREDEEDSEVDSYELAAPTPIDDSVEDEESPAEAMAALAQDDATDADSSSPAESEAAAEAADETNSEGKADADETKADGQSDESAKDETTPPVDDFENLFNIAMLEEAERESRAKRRQQEEKRLYAKVVRTKPDGTVVVAPSCQCMAIVVTSEHFGKVMRCPKCHEKFRVPSPKTSARVVKTKVEAGEKKIEAKKEKTLAVHDGTSEYEWWLEDIRLHVFNPEKTKPTAGVVEKKFFPVDIGFSHDHVLVASLASKPGNFGKADKKLVATRSTMKDSLKESKPLEEVKEIVSDEKSVGALAEFELILPAAREGAELLEGQPIFGEGRIGIRIPKDVGEGEVACLSMTISQYREFCRLLAEFYGYAAFTIGSTVPFFNDTESAKCELSKDEFEVLTQLPYYQADDSFELEHIGWECEACGIRFTEAAREEKKLGGKGAKGIAKAKCPTCSQKLGSKQLFRIKQEEGQAESGDSKSDAENLEVAGATTD